MKVLVLAVTLPALWLADVPAGDRFGVGLGREAAAVVGAPRSPVSVAGVARRTTRRVVVAQSATAATVATTQQQAAAAQPPGTLAAGTVVSMLPPGCVQEIRGGVSYQRCGSVYYRAAFQGTDLVYVVQ